MLKLYVKFSSLKKKSNNKKTFTEGFIGLLSFNNSNHPMS